MSSSNFSADVSAWALKSQKRLEAIFRESTQRTVSIAQSRIPVDTGFARASIRASLSSMPPLEPLSINKGHTRVAYDPGEVTLTIASAPLGSTLFIGYTASYAGILESGSSSQAPSGFVRIAAEQWQATVSEVVAEAKSRVG